MVLDGKTKRKLEKVYPILDRINKLSSLSDIELMMVMVDFKPAMADAVIWDAQKQENIAEVRALAKGIGLSVAASRYKYIVNSPQGIFQEVPLTDARLGKLILGVSPSLDKARRGADYYHKKMLDSRYGYAFGKLMGYPECCLRFGTYLCNNQQDKNNFGFRNPAVESLKASRHFDWHLNVFTSSPLPHYPCSLVCARSIRYAKRLFACLDYIDPKRSEDWKQYLIAPASLYWTCADRILLYGNFKSAALGTGEIAYSRVEPLITSSVFYQKVDKKNMARWELMEKALHEGNKLVVTRDACAIYSGRREIARMKKENAYTPVLVKPDRIT